MSLYRPVKKLIMKLILEAAWQWLGSMAMAGAVGLCFLVSMTTLCHAFEIPNPKTRYPNPKARKRRRITQGGRSWQPFGESKNGHKTFDRRIFAIFATNALFLRVIANLQILSSMICHIYHAIMIFLPKNSSGKICGGFCNLVTL